MPSTCWQQAANVRRSHFLLGKKHTAEVGISGHPGNEDNSLHCMPLTSSHSTLK